MSNKSPKKYIKNKSNGSCGLSEKALRAINHQIFEHNIVPEEIKQEKLYLQDNHDTYYKLITDATLEMLDIATESLTLAMQNNTFFSQIVEKYNNNIFLMCNDLWQDYTKITNNLLTRQENPMKSNLDILNDSGLKLIHQALITNIVSWFHTQDHVLIPALKQFYSLNNKRTETIINYTSSIL